MPRFSERYGYTSAQKIFQHKRVDGPLRIMLWNALKLMMWDLWQSRGYHPDSERIENISRRLWVNYLKQDLDALPPFREFNEKGAYDVFKKCFLNCKWFQVFDFVEVLLQDPDTPLDHHSIAILNGILEKENSAYRVVGTEVVEVTDQNEIKAIDEALNHPDAPVREHIQSALGMLSDREAPDYRNSIKEAISAVEAGCKLVTGLPSATLAEALKKIPGIHPALKNSFLALYGFTSDASGVRHCLMEESNLTYADAKFMLVACSAFVSYLRSKTNGG